MGNKNVLKPKRVLSVVRSFSDRHKWIWFTAGFTTVHPQSKINSLNPISITSMIDES